LSFEMGQQALTLILAQIVAGWLALNAQTISVGGGSLIYVACG